MLSARASIQTDEFESKLCTHRLLSEPFWGSTPSFVVDYIKFDRSTDEIIAFIKNLQLSNKPRDESFWLKDSYEVKESLSTYIEKLKNFYNIRTGHPVLSASLLSETEKKYLQVAIQDMGAYEATTFIGEVIENLEFLSRIDYPLEQFQAELNLLPDNPKTIFRRKLNLNQEDIASVFTEIPNLFEHWDAILKNTRNDANLVYNLRLKLINQALYDLLDDQDQIKVSIFTAFKLTGERNDPATILMLVNHYMDARLKALEKKNENDPQVPLTILKDLRNDLNKLPEHLNVVLCLRNFNRKLRSRKNLHGKDDALFIAGNAFLQQNKFLAHPLLKNPHVSQAELESFLSLLNRVGHIIESPESKKMNDDLTLAIEQVGPRSLALMKKRASIIQDLANLKKEIDSPSTSDFMRELGQLAYQDIGIVAGKTINQTSINTDDISSFRTLTNETATLVGNPLDQDAGIKLSKEIQKREKLRKKENLKAVGMVLFGVGCIVLGLFISGILGGCDLGLTAYQMSSYGILSILGGVGIIAGAASYKDFTPPATHLEKALVSRSCYTPEGSLRTTLFGVVKAANRTAEQALVHIRADFNPS